jgi:hypothetical protein
VRERQRAGESRREPERAGERTQPSQSRPAPPTHAPTRTHTEHMFGHAELFQRTHPRGGVVWWWYGFVLVCIMWVWC